MWKRLFVVGSLCALVGFASTGAAEEFDIVPLPSVYKSYGSVLTPDSETLFVIATTGVVLVYDVENDQYLGPIDLREDIVRPSNGAVVGTKLYVQSFQQIAVVDTEAWDLAKLIPQPPYLGSSYGAVVPSPDGSVVYTVGGSTTHLTAIDTETDAIQASLEVGGEYTGLGISPDGSKLYLSNAEQNKLAIVHAATLTLAGVVPFFESGGMLPYPTDVRVCPTDGTVFVGYVDAQSRGRVAVLSPTGEIRSQFGGASFSTGIDITADGRYLVLGSGLILDPKNGTVLGELDMPVVGLSHVTLSPDGLRAYVANVNDPYVRAIEGFVAPLRLAVPPGDEDEITLSLELPSEAGRLYQVGASLATSPGILLTDSRVVPLHIDSLLRHSVSGDCPAFQNFYGTLDAAGKATAKIDLSNGIPGNAMGERMYFLFVTLDSELSRSDVRLVSNLVSFTLID